MNPKGFLSRYKVMNCKYFLEKPGQTENQMENSVYGLKRRFSSLSF